MSGIEECCGRVAALAKALEAVDKCRQELMAERDCALRDAREAGATWRMLQEVSGMGPRGVSLALKRAEQGFSA